MKKRILKYYYNEVGKPLYYVLILIGKYDCTGDGDWYNVCNVSFSFPLFTVNDFPLIQERHDNIIELLEDNSEAKIERLLDELSIAIDHYPELRLLYLPDMLINESNQINWNVFNTFVDDYDECMAWDQFIYNYTNSLGPNIVHTKETNKYIFNFFTYILKNRKNEIQLFQSEIFQFFDKLSLSCQDLVLDSFSKTNKCFKCIYQEENPSGELYVILDSDNNPLLYCCIAN